MLKLTILPAYRPSDEEQEVDPLVYKRFAEARSHSQALLTKYVPDMVVFLKEAVGVLGGGKCGPIVLNLPDEEAEFVEAQLDDMKKLERV